MVQQLAGKVLVAQGGGPTAVINQSLEGVVLEARKFPHISQVYGAAHGVRGIVERGRLCGGRERIESRPGAGTAVFVDLPFVPAEDSP